MKNKNYMMTAAVVFMLLSVVTTVKADNMQKLSEDVRQLVLQLAHGRRTAGIVDDKLCVFIRFSSGDAGQLLSQHGCQKVTQIDDIYIANVPIDQLAPLAACDAVERIETNTSGRLMLDVTPQWVGNKPVYSGLELPQGYDGTGVLMGIVDCGFDLTHPTLYSTDGSRYRLKAVVDDYQVEGETLGKVTPLGREYLTQEEILAKKHTNDVHNNHGTHCIGIAAGSGLGSGYRGIAYGADIIAISSKNAAEENTANSADQVARMKHIFDYATEQNMPCVITYSIGFADLPGDSKLFAECLKKMVGPGRILVAAAGNENMSHVYIQKSPGKVAGAAVDLKSDSIASAFLITDKPFKLKCFASSQQDGQYKLSDSIVFDTSNLPADTIVKGMIHVILENRDSYYKLTVRRDHKEVVFMPFELSGDDATVQMVMFTPYKLKNLNESIFGNNRFQKAQKGNNINLPGTLESAVTVGALNGRQSFTNYRDSVITSYGNKTEVGSIAVFSSCGPTLDGRIKPDVVAPGVNIISAGNSYCSNSFSDNMVTKTLFNDREYPWVSYSGTSMATPCAAGIVALWLQADPTLTPQHVKDIIKTSSKKLKNEEEWPNNTYGNGLIDAYAGIVEVLKGTTGLQHISSHQPTALTIRPAAGRQVRLSFDQAPQQSLCVTVYSVSGTKLYHQTVTPTGATTYMLQVPQAQGGLHIIQINSPETGFSGSEIIRWN